MTAYATRSDLESRYGADEIKKWATKAGESGAASVDARVTAAIANAQSLVDATLLGGPLAIPIALSPIPPVLVVACVQLAAYDLYTSKGAQDFDDNGKALHRLSGEREDALDTLAKVHGGQLRFVADLPPAAYPGVVHLHSRYDDEEASEGAGLTTYLSDFGL